ncbi:GTPase IMAP family member 5-like [Carassius carassius]|uniref:GTPase IMAP family member 5-like n=1 Tax=Carassius carassius TaxID=217509 RepID=UPI002868DC23|nr:GTPase IMAP family member 5-like [Carassius carassius]
MSTTDTRVIVSHNPPRRRKKSKSPPPLMSDLRIALLGKSVSENSLVGNFILGRAAFDSKAPPDVVERVGGRLKDRHLIIINSPQLLQRNISDHQITHTVRECVFLSDPGPHVFILALQYKDFTKKDLSRVKQVLKEFNEHAIKRTIVLTTDKATHRGASHVEVAFVDESCSHCGKMTISEKRTRLCYLQGAESCCRCHDLGLVLAADRREPLPAVAWVV